MENYINNIEGKIITFEKNEIIANENDICNHVYFVISGSVKIFTYSYGENIYLINTINEKQLFAMQLIFSSNNHFLGNIIANKKSIIKVITKQALLNAFNDHHFLELYLNVISNNYLSLQNRLKVLSQKSIKEKILFYLELKSNLLNTNIIPIKSKLSLSEYLNIPRPSLSRELIKLQKEKIIIFDRHSITLL